ncbi:ribosome 60S biogenesis N-terminal-domain-containing protein, partial [Hysterangium stoloniferum]
ALATLRNQLTITSDEDAPGPQDERLLLAKEWLERAPGAQDVFAILDTVNRPAPNIQSLCLGVIACLLDLLSTHFIYHSVAEAIVRTLLLPHHMRQLNANLGETSTDLITLSTLRVFVSMSAYAGGVERRSIMDNFAWGQKSLQKLFFRRKKTNKSTRDATGRSLPDIRTLFINFILSFLSASTPTPLKLSLLEQHRDVFLMIFKGIGQDSYLVVRHILEVCWEGIWCDNKMKRTLKVGIFNERTLNYLLKVYDRALPEDDIDDHIPADVVHHFMLAIMTHPGVGICFRDRGWYPRDNSSEEGASNASEMVLEDEALGKKQGGRIYNKILANIIKGFKVNEDPRQQELTFKILEACPELIAGYWGAANLTLEPRLASRWITNISVLGTIISFSIPTSSFLLPHSQQHDPSPPPLHSILGNILPSVLSKTHLTKGLQSSSALVRHCTALALSKCLVKFNQVLRVFHDTADKLQEDREAGLWSKRTREVETEIEKRVPDFMVIIAMVQQKQPQSGEPNPVKAALISESALRLLWLYHKLFPRLVAEVKFEIGKLLLNVFDPSADATDEENKEIDGMLREENHNGIDVLRQLHVLHLLKESDQFSWLNKSGSSPYSYLYPIFSLHAKTRQASVRQATADLIKNILSSSIVFSHDIAEIDLWLSALPTTRRRRDAKALDGSPLTDEVAGVLAFLDDCLQRCSKTPYRYLEDASKFFAEHNPSGSTQLPTNDPSAFPSPLLMTVVEQLRAKIGANLLTPSDTLAISTFIRKLTVSLVSKLQDLNNLKRVYSKLNEILSSSMVVPNSLIMKNAIQREAVLLSNSLDFLRDPTPEGLLTTTHPAVQIFLKDVEGLSIPSSETAASNAAYELIDWMRLVDIPLHYTEAKRLFGAILRLWPAALTEFFYQLDPRRGHLWLTVEDHLEVVEQYLPFEWAHLHSTSTQISQKSVQSALVDSFFSPKSWSSSPTYRVSIGIHRLTASQSALRETELSLFATIMQDNRLDREASSFTRLKHKVFLECEPIREICSLTKLVNATFDSGNKADQEVVRVYCDYWAAQSEGLTSFESKFGKCVKSLPWIPFMPSTGLVKQLHSASSVSDHHRFNNAQGRALKLTIETLTLRSNDIQVMAKLQETVKGLMTVRHNLTDSTALDQLVLSVVETGQPLGLGGMTLSAKDSENISVITESAQVQWSNRSINMSLDPAFISTLLRSDSWNETISKIISSSLYRSSEARNVFQTWMLAILAPDLSLLEKVIVPLHAFLDVMTLQTQSQVVQLTDVWVLIIIDCLSRANSRSTIRILCASIIKMIFLASSSDHHRYISCIKTEIDTGNESFLNPESIYLFSDLHQLYGSTFSGILALFVDEALKWMVRQCTGDELSAEELSVIEALSQSFYDTKAHLVEPLMKAAIQNCLHVSEILKCLASLILSTKLKPVVINRYIQNIVQQSQMSIAADASSHTREPFISLLHAMFHTHPINTCQPSHITPLTQLYGGTLSLPDQLLLTIFYLYERERKESTASIFCAWSTSPSGSVSADIVKAIISLDASKVFRTCTAFPTRRSSDGSVVNKEFARDGNLYDPLFLTLLVGQFLVQKGTISSTTWVQLFRSNIFSLLICALTSRDEEFRKLAVTILGGVFQRVQDAEFLERNQVIYILNILRDLLPSESFTTSIPRLSTYPTILLAHALRSIFYPSSFLYPVVSRFLLQRPELDTTDVPMLYSLLYSSEDGEWAKERTWMIRFLTEAMHDGGAADWAILKRRHTWDLIASMWQAARLDERQLRRGILEFLANLSSNPHSASSLVLRSSIILWIEMQLQIKMANSEEYVAWTKILENLIVAVDGDRANKITRGDYNLSIARCLRLVLYSVNNSDLTNTVSNLELLQLISRVVLRLANKPFGSQDIIADIIHDSVGTLQRFESSISWSNATEHWQPIAYLVSQRPHHARSLFELSALKDDAKNDKRLALQGWAETSVMLWQAAMTLEGSRRQSDVNTWNVLTCRVLILRASPWFSSTVTNNQMQLVEWARKEAAICFLSREAIL